MSTEVNDGGFSHPRSKEKKKIMNTTDLKSFNYLENGEVLYSPIKSIKTEKVLDKGVYKVKYLGHPENRVALYKEDEKEDVKIYDFPAKNYIDSLFKSFFNNDVKDFINNAGFLHKVGLLLHGKEGTGKTTILRYYYNQEIEKNNALVFYMDCVGHDTLGLCWTLIENIRKVQDNPIVIVFEECDVLITNHAESVLKMILDGNKSIENCIFLATTNYIDKIPEALKNRKSRFKNCLKIGGLEDVSVIIRIMENMLDGVIDKEFFKPMADKLLNKTLDEVKQFCIDRIMDIESYDEDIITPVGFTKNKVQ
jgi:hypothetical protein